MARIRLTDSLARKLPPPGEHDKDSYVLIRDAEVVGLSLRITRNNARSWTLGYCCHRGREHRYTLGSFPDWPTATAREEAKRLKRLVDQGGCPAEDQAAERAAPTVADLADRYMQEHAPRLRASSARDARSLLAQWIIPELGRLKVADVRHADVERLHSKITGYGTPTRANRTLALLSKMFTLALKWEWCAAHPVKGAERNQEGKRQRYLRPGELERLTAALAAHPDQGAANAIRLLLLTGARRGEVLGATWSQFNLGDGTWTKAASETKQKRLHFVPLSAPARQLLAGLRAASPNATLVFPGVKLRRLWEAVRREPGLADLRIHDLRHSYASQLVSAGLSLPVIGALLGHSNPTTTSRYAHLFDEPLRAATERVGAAYAAAAGGAPGAQVTALPGRKRGTVAKRG